MKIIRKKRFEKTINRFNSEGKKESWFKEK